MDEQFMEDVLFGTGGLDSAPKPAASPAAKKTKAAPQIEVDDSFIDEVLGTTPPPPPASADGKVAPSEEEGILLAQVRRANELSHKEGIPFPEALERVKNEDISFFGGVRGTFGGSLKNRLVGMGQATGLDKAGEAFAVGLTRITKGEDAAYDMVDRIKEQGGTDAILREGVTERRQEMDRVKEKAPVGGVVGDFAGDATALAPTLVAGGVSLPAVVAGGAIAGGTEGFTRSEGVGEDRKRIQDALIGTVVGGVTGGLFYGAGKAYSKYLSDKVNKAVGKGIDYFHKQNIKGIDRFSADGQRLLRERGFDPAKIDSDAASKFFREEANALTSAQRLTNKVNKILKNTDPEKVKTNLARFEELGIEPTLGQATGDDVLLAVERNLGLRGNPAISEPIKARMRTQAHEQLPVSTQVMLDRMSTNSLEAVSDRLVNVSRAIKDDMLSEQAKRAAPLYEAALQPTMRVVRTAPVKRIQALAKGQEDVVADLSNETIRKQLASRVLELSGDRTDFFKLNPSALSPEKQAVAKPLTAAQSKKIIDKALENDDLVENAAFQLGYTSLRSGAVKPADDILSHPRIQNLIKQVRKDMDVAPDVEGLADDSVPFMHEVKMRLDGLVGKAKSSGDRDRARRLTQLKNHLVSALDDATVAKQDMPDIGVKAGESIYKKARNIYADDQDLINKFQDGVLGSISDLSEGRIDTATKKIFAMRDINRFREAKNRIRGKDPELWDAMVARHITDVLEEFPSVPNKDYRAFAKKLAGKERTGKFLQVALEDNKPTQKLFNDMMLAIDDLTNLDLARYPKGSDTMPNFDRANFVDDYFEDIKFKAVSRLSTDILKDVGNEMQNKQLIGTLSDLSRLLTDPDSVNDLARGQIQRRISNYIMSKEGQELAKARMGKVLNRHDRAMMFYRAALGEQYAGRAIDTAGKAVRPLQRATVAPEAVDLINKE